MRRIIIFVTCFWAAPSPLWGKIVFHSERDGNVEIYTMDADGSNQMRLTFNAVSDTYPVWSPNGRQIAFASSRDGNYEIYVMDADGMNQRNLTNHPEYDSFPAWSPDGTQIAFVSSRNRDEKHYRNIFVMNADGSHVKQITNSYATSSPRWSPDGNRIAYQNKKDEFSTIQQIHVMEADGTNPWRVSNPKVNVPIFLNGWSRDGTQIFYSEVRDPWWGDQTMLVIATLHSVKNTVRRFQLVPLPDLRSDTAIFSPDGKSILFAGRDKGDWDIYRFRFADKQLIQLTDILGKDAAPHEWDPRLSVPYQQHLLPKTWGCIKATASSK